MVKQKEREPVYALIPESEMLERHKKHLNRMHDVAISRELINHSLRRFDKLEEERTRKEHWDDYVRCDDLPRPFNPSETRSFIAKERHYEDIETDKSIDWTLSVDERSILNQNIYRIDRTRRALKKTAINPAEYIDRDVQLCLDTLRKLDIMLDNDVELQRMNIKRLEDVLLVRGDIEQEIVSLFDRLAYRILAMQGAHMNTVDGSVATWSYKCQPWAMDIWGLLIAPVRFDQMEIPAMLAKLSLTGVSVQIPLSVLKDCLTLRCIHTSFDSYSQNAKSYEPVVTESTTYPTAGIVDIENSAENEWLLQLDIQKEILADMILKRQHYEELMVLITEKAEQAAKEARSGNDKGGKIAVPKAPREPPMVPPGMVPDIYEEFVKRENTQYNVFLEEVYHPMTLNLSEDEINLRQRVMLGGIYSIMFVGRPGQTQFEKYNIVLHEDGRVLHTMPEVVAVTQDPQDELRASALSAGRGSRFRLTMENVNNMKLDDDELPYFIIVMELAPELCLWGEPVVCQYLTGLEPIDQHRTSVTSLARTATEKLKKAAPKRRMPEGHADADDRQSANIFRPSVRSSIRFLSRSLSQSEKSAGLANFSLNRYMNHQQLWSLERHCLPRLLSSFKFPGEFVEELQEALANQKQSRKRGIVRRHSVEQDEELELPHFELDFESQQNPERLFPVFNRVESVVYRDEASKDSETMYGLLGTIQDIKDKYLQRQPVVEPFLISDRKSTIIPEEPAPITKPPKSKPHHKHKSRLRHSHSSVESGQSAFSTAHEESMGREPMREILHWTTKHISSTTFDRPNRTLTIKTDRLGIFGLAFKRYEHFPFGDWSLQPNEENPDEIIFQLDTFHVRIYLYITAKGVRGYVTDLSKAYTANPVKYIEILEPISDFRELRRIFVENNINIFAENDASFYIERDYFSIKHVATEHHIYDVMALHCKLMKFYRSSWNPVATRRDIIVGMKNAKDHSELSEVTVRITPEKTTFVEVKELCSDAIDVIKLHYTETWRNIGNCTDLHQAICSMNPHATDVRNKDPLLLYNVKRMLSEIRLLSFS